MKYFVGFLKFIDEVLIVVGLILVGLFIYLARVSHTADNVGELLHESAKKDLSSVAAVSQKDVSKLAPIGSYASYRRCGSGVFSARLTGEPLACSASNLTDTLLSDPGAPGQTFYRQFGAACNRHDLCYIHGDVTYGFSRADCDRAFLADILKTCRLIYNQKERQKLFGIPLPFNLRRYCEFRGSVGYSAVKAFGWQYFYNNYSPVCDYEAGPHAVRDHVVSGKFFDGVEREYVVALRLGKDFDTLNVSLSRVNEFGQSEEISLQGGQITISDVEVLDRKRTCLMTALSVKKDKLCPENFKLGSTLVTVRDLLRFNPVVVDHDGDGKDEIVLVSVSPDFGLGFTHIRFEGEESDAQVSTAAYLSADRRRLRETSNVCEWDLEFQNCYGSLKLEETFRVLAPGRYKRAIKNLVAAKEKLATATEAGDPKKIKEAEGQIKKARQQIKKYKPYKDAAASADIRRWSKEMEDYDKTKLRREDYFILSNDGTNQKLAYQIIPLRVSAGEPDKWVYDLVFMSGHSFVDEAGNPDAAHVFRRFHYDVENGAWTMTRDAFTNDGHLVAKCSYGDVKERRRFDQYRRYQYRAFPMRLHGYGDDRLATFQREKCPTSTINPSAGSLGDVDVMVYSLEEDYSEPSDFYDKNDWENSRRLQLAYTSWFPLIWTEAAHPLMSSEKARDKKIHIVGTYVGGAAKITYPVIAVLRDSQDLHARMLRASNRRLPDTYGKLSERYYLNWDRSVLGYPESYFELPSVLATVGANGEDSLSLVYFNNPATAEWQKNISEAQVKLSDKAKPAEGTFRTLIVPIPEEHSREFSDAKLIECPVSAVGQHGNKEFSPQFRGYQQQISVRTKQSHHAPSKWKKHFLRHEPVLSGDFVSGAKGALASVWRDPAGEIAVTALFHDGTQWLFGGESCKTIADVKVGRLF